MTNNDKIEEIINHYVPSITQGSHYTEMLQEYGDGCVHFIPDRGCLRINIVGTLEFLTSLQAIFVNTLGFSKVKIVQKSINNNFSLQINRSEDIYCFYKKLYMNERCLNLHRKKNIFDKWIITR